MIRILSILAMVLLLSVTSAQGKTIDVFQDVTFSSINKSNSIQLIHARRYRAVKVNMVRLRDELKGVAHRGSIATIPELIINLPLPDGSTHQYHVLQNDTMHPALAAQFPEIKTYDGYGIDNKNEFVKFDVTPRGFHAMILSPGKSPVFIDPYLKGTTRYLMVYEKKNFITNKTMINDNVLPKLNYFNKTASFVNYSSCNLKQYRLALAATAQYTLFFGGTVPQALAAQVTTMNRVNGVYETDIAVTMQIISNNNTIIYTNPAAQPYTSGNGVAMAAENQNNLDAVIGTNNYDIGHVFDQNIANSGFAPGLVCNAASKAEGVTGSIAPVGDPFDIDFVAHEMGHQFDADHTQNNPCNRNDPTAVEPGSGSTIMGYAGICAPNVQANSNAYFHGISLEQIGAYVSGAGGVCAVQTAIGVAPTIAPPGNITIPASTPFLLTASATGPGSNGFTYVWEQMNNAISPQPPQSNSIDGPNFRSVLPTLNPIRYLPNLTALANNGPFTWEVLSDVSRTMNFRITVRRNEPGGSCNAYQDMSVAIDAGSGPFLLTYPSAAGIQWLGTTQQTVRWNVANTNNPPVNAAQVDLLLSTDGGFTYPMTLVQGAPNNGQRVITVPNINTATARMMVRANGTFFSISANNFSIASVVSPVTAPQLTEAVRNPLNKNNAFVYYSSLGNVTVNDRFSLNGVQAAGVTLDIARGRFVISLINTPRRVENVSINVLRGGLSATSNTVTIPGIL